MSGELHQISAAIGALQAEVAGLTRAQAAEVKKSDERHAVVTSKLEDIGDRMAKVETHGERLNAVEAVAADYTTNKNKIIGATALAGLFSGSAAAGVLIWLKGIFAA